MKILIVDDTLKRYARLLPKLQELEVQRSDIDLVSSISDARVKLENYRYDLLILDILVPEWPESDESSQYSIDLLTELHLGDDLIKPRQIVGITGDLSGMATASRQFQEYTWVVVEYSASNDEWVNRIIKCVSYLKQSSSVPLEENTYHTDLAIICALEKPELEEVLKLPWNWQSPRPINDLVFVHDGHLVSNGRTIRVSACFAPRMGMVASALHAATMISALRPKIIAMCGICAGVRSKTKIGDIILADPAWDFQSGKRVKDGSSTKFSIAPHQLPIAAKIRTHVEQLRGDRTSLAEIYTKFGSDAPNAPSIVIGPLASGSAVLADGQIIEDIKLQHRELVGVEMEAYGVYAAAHAASPQPLYFALKSVCDFADPDKADNGQRFAAYTSASVLQLLMERYGDRLIA